MKSSFGVRDGAHHASVTDVTSRCGLNDATERWRCLSKLVVSVVCWVWVIAGDLDPAVKLWPYLFYGSSLTCCDVRKTCTVW